MLHEVDGDTERKKERGQIRLMQKVFGKEHAPEVKYSSMQAVMEKRGQTGPGKMTERR